MVVLDKSRVDGMVKHAGLSLASGAGIHTLGNLQALELDPAGGSFAPLQPIPGLPKGAPHLLFAGQRIGATVLSTVKGGTLARVDGQYLGAQTIHGGPLGLDVATTTTGSADLGGLVVLPRRPLQPIVETEQLSLPVITGNESLVFYLAGFAPGASVWVLGAAATPGKGGALSAIPGETGMGWPWRLSPFPSVGWAVAVDDRGRARIELPLGGPIPWPFLAVMQAYEVGSGRLSAPGSVWCY